jgi:signal transduction histidine kinase
MLPFFTTKPNHIGLGLSMAFRFIEMRGGMIKIKSAITNGTEVLILLPLNGDVQDACR